MTAEHARRYMRVVLAPSKSPEDEALRAPRPSDSNALGHLMHRAYHGTIDYEGESEDESVREVEKTFRGDYGAFAWEASQVYEREGKLLSATLVTRWQERPFVAFSITDPDHKRRGLARKCMLAAMGILHAAGEHELRLAVTLANEPAVMLYRSLGFTVEE